MTKKRQMTLHLLDNYTKNPAVCQPTSEGATFSQKDNKNKNKDEHYDRQFCKDKNWYNCGNTGHPVSHCLNSSKETPDKKHNGKKVDNHQVKQIQQVEQVRDKQA